MKIGALASWPFWPEEYKAKLSKISFGGNYESVSKILLFLLSMSVERLKEKEFKKGLQNLKSRVHC